MTQLSVLIPNSVSAADSWSADRKTALSSQQLIKRTSGLLSVVFSAQPSSFPTSGWNWSLTLERLTPGLLPKVLSFMQEPEESPEILQIWLSFFLA